MVSQQSIEKLQFRRRRWKAYARDVRLPRRQVRCDVLNCKQTRENEGGLMSIFLGIDIGTSGTKTLAINERGKILAEATSRVSASIIPSRCGASRIRKTGGRPRSRPSRQVVKQAKLKPADVKAIGLSGQMHGSVFLDKRNQRDPPGACLWNDQRTAAECDEIERRAGGRAELISMVANPALTGFTAPKILWLRNHEPKTFRQDWPRCCCPRTTSAAA